MRNVNYVGRTTWEKEKKEQYGFALWELLVVLFIMGVLLTLFTPHFGSAAKHVRNRVDQANVQRIEGAAQLYRIDVGTYPQSVTDMINAPMGVNGWQGPYLEEVPINPFDSEQGYQINASGRASSTANTD